MLGRKLAGRYELAKILGAGGFGQTYLAVDTHCRLSESSNSKPANRQSDRLLGEVDLDRDLERADWALPQAYCVVKQLKPASQDSSFLSVARRLFETEVKTLQRLGSHPQIPELLDSFEEENEFYLVQEFVDGTSLEDEIAQGQFDEDQAIALLESVLPVLHFIHQNHVIHRDLKPDNLIRRRDSGEIVLIDFGAVKEIRTRIITGEQTSLTIGIGTQGYTPSEQLSGKPRYSSDIFALGMTVIQALTGKSPVDLPEDSHRLEACWETCAQVSPGLTILLNKMTRHYIYQRYDSVEAVQCDLARLADLPAEVAAADTCLETSISPRDRLVNQEKIHLPRWQMGRRAKGITVALSTLLTSVFVLGLRQVGAFVPAELAAYDAMVGARAEDRLDPRLLIVEVTEKDMRSRGQSTPSDALVAQVISTLQQYQPASIGLDLRRDLPQGEGRAQLLESLRSPNVVVVSKLPELDKDDLIPPPLGVSSSQVSFSNILPDRDLRVRRAVLARFANMAVLNAVAPKDIPEEERATSSEPASVSMQEPVYSLGTELAFRYLSAYAGIEVEDDTVLTLGGTRFYPLSSSFGGYRHVDNDGYQMLIRYRALEQLAERITLSQVLDNNFDAALVKNKIVLIGPVSQSSQDLFSTPFNRGDINRTPGVVLHAQVASQILSAVLDGDILPWAWPDWAEVVWIVLLTGVGSGLMVLTQRGPILIAFGVGGLLTAMAVSWVCFELGGWVPVAAPVSAFFLSAAGARISKSYQRRYWEAHRLS